jgi:hypothetical protein
MVMDTALAFSAVLVLCVISGLADSQGFVHASAIWRDEGVSWASLARSSIGFVVGMSSYWMSIRFMNRVGLATTDLQYLVWFLITLIGVAVATGSVRRWTSADVVVGVMVVAGLCWLTMKGAASCEAECRTVSGAESGQQPEQGRGGDGDEHGTDVDASRLGADQVELNRVGDLLVAAIHVLQPARSEGDAGFRAHLKEPDCGSPRRQEDEQPPRAWRVEQDQAAAHADRDGQEEESADQAALAFARTDVGADGVGHGVARTRTRAPSVNVSGG